MKIYFLDNKIIGANIIDYSSEKLPYYPASNIKASSTKSRWRTDELQAMNEFVTFDLASAKSMEYFQALGTNIRDTAWIYVELADDSGFTTGLVSYSLKGAELKAGKFFTSVQKRYLRLKIYDGICFVGTSGGSTISYDSCVVDGKIYVCSNHRISIFDAETLEYISYFGSYGSGDGQFNQPFSICSDETYLYVADRMNHRIQKFTLAGIFVSKIGTQGAENDQFDQPRCIRYSDGKLYIADNVNNRVKIHLASDLSFVDNVPVAAASNSCWVDETNNYLIVRTGTDIYVYNLADKSLVRSKTGQAAGYGVALLGDYVYISDLNNNKISKYLYSDLSFVASYSPGTGSLPGQLTNPYHLNVWNGNILCSNYGSPYYVLTITPGLKFQSNPDGYIEIGKLNAAEKKTFARHVVTQFSSKHDDKSLVIETENLVVFSVRKELLKHVAFTLQQLTTADKQMLENFISSYGLTRSFAVYIEDESQGNYTLPNMKISGMPQIETVAYNNYSVKIDLVEEK